MTKKTVKKKTFKVGRDATTGRFISIKEAQRRKKTAIVETIKISTVGRKVPGSGTSGGGPRKK